MKILFLHGWHSVPGGVKPTYLKSHGHEVVNPALDDDDFTLAVKTAQAEFDKHQPQVVVGSSRGGAVAMNINSGSAKLVLLCPAWKNWGTAKTVKEGTAILHSRADDVIPFADSEELAKKSGLADESLIEVGNDHRLADPHSLEIMLELCKTGNEPVDEDDPLQKDWTGLCYTAALCWPAAAKWDVQCLILCKKLHRWGQAGVSTGFLASGYNMSLEVLSDGQEETQARKERAKALKSARPPCD